MKEKGIHVLRIKNEDLENMGEVLVKINDFLEQIS
jgi:very-short-patch-repair endonuclease